MSTKDAVKEKLVDPAIERGDLASLEKAAAIWKITAEAEKVELDISETAARKRSEHIRFWIPILAPLISSAALVVTLIFQVYQFKETGRLSREASEDSAWRGVLQEASQTHGPEVIFAMSQIKSFVGSPRYGKTAREISVFLLANNPNPDGFNVLFPEIQKTTDWTNLNDLTGIEARIRHLYDDLPDDLSEAKTNQSFQNILTDLGLTNITQNTLNQLNKDLKNQVDCVANGVVSFLHNSKSTKPTAMQIDFTGTKFYNADFSDVDLSKSIIQDCTFEGCLFSNTDLSDTLELGGNYWTDTAWWRAKRIGPNLLESLENNFPFNSTNTYFEGSILTNDFEININRLKKENGQLNKP